MNYLTARGVAAAMGGKVSPTNPDLARVPGPGHSKYDDGLMVFITDSDPEGFTIYSHHGDDWRDCRDYVRQKLGLERPDFGKKPMQYVPPKPKGERTGSKRRVAEYVYLDQNGQEYHRVIRHEYEGGAKTFTQEHMDVETWVTGDGKLPPIPYNLPSIIARRDEPIWLVEGEKNADDLTRLGFLATTAKGGASAFPTTPEFSAWFDESTVYALPDNDESGRKWTERVKQAIPHAKIVTIPGLPEKGDVSDWLMAGGTPQKLLAIAAETHAYPLSSLTPTPYTWQNPTTIPRREWLYGRHLIRRYVSTTISPGGLGKSSMVLVEALAMVSRQPLLEERVHTPDPLRVWYWNGEDPNDEAARRIQAAAIQHRLSPEDIGDRLFVDSGREMRLKLASMVRGEIILDEGLFEDITDALLGRRIDVWTIDPFISAHQVSENDNGAIDAVIKRLGIVAERANCAIELVHHVRKGNGQSETTVEDARGASALIGGVRSARVLNVMTKDIAEAAKIDPKDRYSHFSVTNGKSNLGPRSDNGLWRKIVSVDLENGGLALDSSDHVGVVTAFKMPDFLSDVPHNAADIAQDVARQFDMGRVSSQSKDWFGHIVGPRIGIDTETKEGKHLVKTLIKKWLDNDILAVRMGEDANRNKRDFICLPESANPYVASAKDDTNDAPF